MTEQSIGEMYATITGRPNILQRFERLVAFGGGQVTHNTEVVQEKSGEGIDLIPDFDEVRRLKDMHTKMGDLSARALLPPGARGRSTDS